MCVLFSKKKSNELNRNNHNLSDDDKKKIIMQIHGLGFEVGYHHHSEMGWVKDSYDKLLDKVTDNSFKDLLKNYYIKGKTDGIEKKKFDLRTNIKVVKEAIHEPILQVEQTQFIADDSELQNDAIKQYAPTAHASMTSKPGALNKPVVVDLPQSLSGFRPLNPYKKGDS